MLIFLKRRKKHLVMLMLFTLLLSIASPAMANPTVKELTQEQALEIVLKTFSVPKDMFKTNISYQYNQYTERSTWQFNWNSNQQKGEPWRSINVEIDAVTGEIVNYWDESPANETKTGSKEITNEEAQKIAEEFIKRMQPDKFSLVKYNPPVDVQMSKRIWFPPYYDFYYQRTVNGIVFPENGINVGVNRYTGKVMRFNLNWENLEFSDPKAALKQEDAQQIFETKLKLVLKYMRPETPFPSFTARKEANLYYVPNTAFGSPVFIDATSGNVVGYDGQPVTLPVIPEPKLAAVTESTYSNETKAESAKQEQEQKEVTLSKDEALAVVIKYVTIPDNYTLRSVRYNEGWGWGAGKTWDFEYGAPKEPYTNPINVSIDAKTGQLKGYWHWEQNTGNNSPKFSWEQGKDEVLKFLAKAQPDIVDQVLLVSAEPQKREYAPGEPAIYNYQFTRMVNGIPFDQNVVNIDFNVITGRVSGFNFFWDKDAKFTKADNIISVADATKVLFEKNQFKLKYMRKYNPNEPMSKTIQLVYALLDETPRVVNAVTGEIEMPWQMVYIDNARSLKDVGTHWAAEQIRSLASVDVISGNKEGDFKPDQPVTRAEFVKMLVNSLNLKLVKTDKASFTDVATTEWFFAYVETGVAEGIIKGNGNKFNPNGQISRQEMAVMVVRALKMKTANDAQVNFKDAKQVAVWAKTAVAKAADAGLITGSNNAFRPTAKTTKAEAAAILYRMLTQGNGNVLPAMNEKISAVRAYPPRPIG